MIKQCRLTAVLILGLLASPSQAQENSLSTDYQYRGLSLYARPYWLSAGRAQDSAAPCSAYACAALYRFRLEERGQSPRLFRLVSVFIDDLQVGSIRNTRLKLRVSIQ